MSSSGSMHDYCMMCCVLLSYENVISSVFLIFYETFNRSRIYFFIAIFLIAEFTRLKPLNIKRLNGEICLFTRQEGLCLYHI